MRGGLRVLERDVKRLILEQAMVRPGERVVVAVSGGPDSVCLLFLLHALAPAFGLTLVIAHMEHGLRPGQDEEETRFVASLARALDLPLALGRPKSAWAGRGGGLESWAREERYAFLRRAQWVFGAHRIALGHTRDDQAETLLLRLIRGAGPAGLGGMALVRQSRYIRPLLETGRRDVMAYLAQRGIPFVTDPSNLRGDFLRNRVRHEVLPLLDSLHPGVARRLARTADIAREQSQWLEQEALAWIEKEAELQEGGILAVPLDAFASLHCALQHEILRRLLDRAPQGLKGIGARHIQSLRRLALSPRPQASWGLPGRCRVRRRYGFLLFGPDKEEKVAPFCMAIPGPGTWAVRPLGGLLEVELREGPQTPDRSPWVAFMDGGHVSFPLRVRPPRPGDRMVPLGMKGHKKLKDLFVDLKLPLETRARTPVVTSQGKVVWVVGIRQDERFRLLPTTQRVLRMEWKRA